jgi:hypothetical protein
VESRRILSLSPFPSNVSDRTCSSGTSQAKQLCLELVQTHLKAVAIHNPTSIAVFSTGTKPELTGDSPILGVRRVDFVRNKFKPRYATQLGLDETEWLNPLRRVVFPLPIGMKSSNTRSLESWKPFGYSLTGVAWRGTTLPPARPATQPSQLQSHIYITISTN